MDGLGQAHGVISVAAFYTHHHADGASPRTGDHIPPGSRAQSSLSDMSLATVVWRMGRSEITMDGFRSTFRDWCSE
jgi:hypothetical protein